MQLISVHGDIFSIATIVNHSRYQEREYKCRMKEIETPMVRRKIHFVAASADLTVNFSAYTTLDI